MEKLIEVNFQSLPLGALISAVSMVLLSYGFFTLFSSVIGLLRLPDLYTKIHAASVGEGLAIPLIMIGIAINYGTGIESLKIILLMIILLITNPIASYCLAQSALYAKILPLGTKK